MFDFKKYGGSYYGGCLIRKKTKSGVPHKKNPAGTKIKMRATKIEGKSHRRLDGTIG